MSLAETVSVEARPITQGPRFHWFGYYDKLQFDPSNRFVLCMEVDFEGRSPTVGDRIRIGMIDLEDNARWIELGETSAWCWQQGCMLQWRPGSDREVVYNDRAGNGFCAHILNVRTGKRRTIPHPVYALSPDGKTAVSLDFARTGRLRPGYGYAGRDPSAADPAPADCGIYRVDLERGSAERIITIAQMAAIPCPTHPHAGCLHWFNHLLVSPDGSRFIFLHRWHAVDDTGIRSTRMSTANLDGSDLRILQDGGRFSHFIWRDPDHILAWAQPVDRDMAFHLYNEKTGEVEVVGREAMTQDGHCTYLAGGEWILNDGYPQSRGRDERARPLYLYHPDSARRVDLGSFRSPLAYDGEWRCDLHPRSSRDGRLVTIDSVHGGNGRQLYLLDIASVIAEPAACTAVRLEVG
ncbi:MAG: hypothetical protein JXR37_13715 [Kiritimatiellae bacterium]|nr:hypothetical protein [Kiritimatiellia bacterium]